MDLKTENKKKETPQSWSLGEIELRLLPWLFYYFIICAAAFTADSADFLIPKITIHKPNPLREPELVKTHPKTTPVLLCLFLLAQHPPDAGPASAAFIPPQLPQQSVPGEFRGLFKDKPRGFGVFPASEGLTVHRNPLVEVLALGQHHGLPEVAAAQRGLGVFEELVLVGSLGNVLLWLECFGRPAPAGKRKSASS